jgi:hypothetical protein
VSPIAQEGITLSLLDKDLFPQSDLITPRDLVILDGELVRYFLAIYQDEKTDIRTKFLAACKLAELSKQCGRSLERTEQEVRNDRIEAFGLTLESRMDGIERNQGRQLIAIQALLDHAKLKEGEDDW